MTLGTQSTILGRVGREAFALICQIGDFVEFTAQMITWLAVRRPCKGTIIPNFYQIGVRSVPVVAITGTFIGMVLAVQSYHSFKSMGLETRIGWVINNALVTELGPVLAATMLAGRIGSAMAAEIGTMKVTEQIDALSSLGTNPVHYLVVPRFLACVALIPLLTVIADLMGILGGEFVSTRLLSIDSFHYWKYSRSQVGLWDISSGIFKSLFFGAEIAVISCYRGFKSGAGAEGVGTSATEAFVYSFIAILASDFLLGMILNSIYFTLWPEGGGFQ